MVAGEVLFRARWKVFFVPSLVVTFLPDCQNSLSSGLFRGGIRCRGLFCFREKQERPKHLCEISQPVISNGSRVALIKVP